MNISSYLDLCAVPGDHPSARDIASGANGCDGVHLQLSRSLAVVSCSESCRIDRRMPSRVDCRVDCSVDCRIDCRVDYGVDYDADFEGWIAVDFDRKDTA